ncbi:uncharacterized protein Z519_06708 [Cladophialophora bantiana CBS 173.52]|uniref:Ankyrin repeat protein n=1 Tax=Cladophialophora bantiana (strain ATCC 10958 / CBS 173.52 / CDC B-1940 / NIH 8579) TaxID=1442370 RepID=A0A0D2I7R4_CLAB1|nr:uncharacterized protein Z519_06708 [Cladophialophora bantiana CBS 173.52]KIW92859.1 hypothetical protein Z519_06708 [Cladophialophora bantiana CBS 173.52]
MLLTAAEDSPAIVKRLLEAGGPPESVWSRLEVSDPQGLKVLDEDAMLTEESETRPQQQRIESAFKVDWTPLMVTCQMGHLEVVTMLVNAGANPAPKALCLRQLWKLRKRTAD